MANIGKSITIRGDLTGDEDLLIEGNVEGKIQLPNNEVTIGANGNIKAAIDAKCVIVVGRVAGNITATDRLEIQATGTVEGDVSAARLIVEEGAVLDGAIKMGQSKTLGPQPQATKSTSPATKAPPPPPPA